MKTKNLLICVLGIAMLAGCVKTTVVDNRPSRRATVYEDIASPGEVQGVGIESQDIVGMTDRMVRDMLSSPLIAGRQAQPRIIIDDAYFTNESSSQINKKMMTILMTGKMKIQMSLSIGLHEIKSIKLLKFMII